MKKIAFISFAFILIISTFSQAQTNFSEPIVDTSNQKIQILNFATFHMGTTSDAHKTEFDEHAEENKRKVHEIAKKLAAFKPTVILVETTPEYNEKLQKQYKSYKDNPKIKFKSPSEIELLAYELGRLCNTKKIYGIDHKMGYNYKIGFSIKNTIDPKFYNQFYENPIQFYPKLNVDENAMTLFEKLVGINSNYYLDFLMTINADMLTHAGTDHNFEGADEAAKYYKRNLRIYSNLNRIELSSDDRVFILMGGSHTAFLRDFINSCLLYTSPSPRD